MIWGGKTPFTASGFRCSGLPLGLGVLEMWDVNRWDPEIAPSALEAVISTAIGAATAGWCERRKGGWWAALGEALRSAWLVRREP